MTMYREPSPRVPTSKTSMMPAWPISLALTASRRKRSAISGSSETSGRSTLTATLRLMTVCWAS